MGLRRTIRDYLGLGGLDEFVIHVNRVMNGEASHKHYGSVESKLKVIFSSPALLKVFSIQCDLFSLGKIYVYKNGKEIDNDPFLDMIKKPNPFQRQSQFLWDCMFWNMLGNLYIYVDSKIVSNDNRIYALENQKITFPTEFEKYRDMLVLSKGTVDDINKLKVYYNQNGRNNIELEWRNIIHLPDLTNGNGNWFEGNSRIDALYKVISNSEAALDAKNINVNYSGKFMVAGQADPSNTQHEMMAEDEKQDIERKMNGNKSVHAVKSMIDIKRFVENIGNLKLDESYWADYFIIGSMFNIPKDVLEWYLTGGTFENQEKARGAHISYGLQPKGNILCESFAEYFNYTDRQIVIDWEHLPFMQTFAKERAETEYIKTQSLLNLMKAGVKKEQINELLDLDLTELNYETAVIQSNQGQRENNTNT